MRHVYLENNLIAMQDVCKPLLDEDTLLIAVSFSVLTPESFNHSMTIHTAKGTNTIPQKISRVIGATQQLDSISSAFYSCSGQVIAMGKKVKKFRVGDYVACAIPGTVQQTEIISAKENCIIKIDKTNLQVAAFAGIGAFCLEALKKTKTHLGQKISILGLDLLGQTLAQLIKSSGCFVAGIDPDSSKRTCAKELGINHLFDPNNESFFNDIEYYTDHNGFDICFVADPNLAAFAPNLIRKGGSVLFLQQARTSLDTLVYNQKNCNLYFINSSTYDTDKIKSNQMNLKTIVKLINENTLNFDLSCRQISASKIQNFSEAHKEKPFTSCLLDFESDKKRAKKENTLKKEITFQPATKDEVRIGLIGAGKSVSSFILPTISKIKDAKISAILDIDPNKSIKVQKRYGNARLLSNDDELFSENVCDVVFISSQHKKHCDQIVKALEQGKAVFAEKPMATDFDQLKKIRSVLEKNNTAPLCLSYYRSLAPFMQRIKEQIDNRFSPLIIDYRMNVGLTPKAHWGANETGSGRILGEACHIFDLFCFLTGSQPIGVSVESMRANNDKLFPTDNFSAQISFEDGSVCSLVYTSLGHTELGKERMEAHYDSKSIVMNDFLTLTGFGLPKAFNEKALKADKGYEALLYRFFSALKNKTEMPISLNRLDTVAELTLLIDQLACEGGGTKEIV